MMPIRLFTSVDYETTTYLLGTYTLSGSAHTLKLVITSDGWAAAYHTLDYRVERLYDCNHPSPDDQVFNRPETALTEVAAALGVSNPAINFYDYRNPQAERIILHWLIITNGFANSTSTITLPLDNTYLERGYMFCTAFTNSKFWLNGVIVDEQGSLSQPVFRYSSLTENQLRVGQSNAMKIEAFSIFGNGLMSGVAVEYSGATVLTTSGGYRRDIDLIYPATLGPQLTIYKTALPLVQK